MSNSIHQYNHRHRCNYYYYYYYYYYFPGVLPMDLCGGREAPLLTHCPISTRAF